MKMADSMIASPDINTKISNEKIGGIKSSAKMKANTNPDSKINIPIIPRINFSIFINAPFQY